MLKVDGYRNGDGKGFKALVPGDGAMVLCRGVILRRGPEGIVCGVDDGGDQGDGDDVQDEEDGVHQEFSHHVEFLRKFKEVESSQMTLGARL